MQFKSIDKRVYLALAVIAVLIILAVLGTTLGGRQRTLERAFVKLFKAETLHATTLLEINLPSGFRGGERPFTKFQINIDGDVQRADDGTPELGGTLFVEARGRGNIFFADGDLRVFRDEVTFRLENLPVFLNPSGSLIRKWTAVQVPLLQTRNGAEARQGLESLLETVRYAGQDEINGTAVSRYAGQLTADQEERLYQLFRQGVSGNRALHVIARLLQANNVDSLEVWIDESRREVRRIRAHFARPLSDGSAFDFATVQIDFRDFGGPVTIDRPSPQASVRPEVFGKLFGAGEIEEIP